MGVSKMWVLLKDGHRWNPKSLFTRAIDLDEKNIIALEGLGHILEDGEWIRLANQSTWSRRQLLTQARTLRRRSRKSCDPLTKERWWRHEGNDHGHASCRRIPMAT